MEPAPINPVELLATVAVLGAVVKAIVDAIRRQWPRLDGLAVQVVAIGIGAAIAWTLDVRATAALLESVNASVGRLPVPAVDYLVTGTAMAAAAGFLAEIARRSGPAATPVIIEVDGEGNPVH